MATIANLAVKIGANAEGLLRGLKTAGSAVQDFGQTTRTALAEATAGFSEIVATLTTAFNAIKNPVGGSLDFIQSKLESVAGTIKGWATSIPIIGDSFKGIPTTAGEFGSWIKDSASHIKEITGLAAKYGTTTEEMAGFQVAAGSAFESSLHGLGHFEKTLGEAAAGSVEARQKFERLGLSWKALDKGSSMSGLGAFADKIASLPTHAQRAAAANDLLGKSGVDMMAILEKGSAGLEAARKRASSRGLSFSAEDANAVRNMGAGMKEIEENIRGAGIQISIALAPWIKVVADKIAEWVPAAGGLNGSLQESTSILRDLGSWAIRIGGVFESMWYSWKASFLDAAAVVAKGMRNLLAGAAFTMPPGVSGKAREMAAQLGQYAKSASESAAASKAEESSAMEKMRERLARWNATVDGIGAGWKRLGDDAKKAADAQARMAEADAIWGQWKAQVEKAQDPLEKYKKSIEEIGKLVADGRHLTAPAGDKMKAGAFEDMLKSYGAKLPEDPFEKFEKNVRKLENAIISTKTKGDQAKEAFQALGTNTLREMGLIAEKNPVEKFQEGMKKIQEMADAPRNVFKPGQFDAAASRLREDMLKAFNAVPEESPFAKWQKNVEGLEKAFGKAGDAAQKMQAPLEALAKNALREMGLAAELNPVQKFEKGINSLQAMLKQGLPMADFEAGVGKLADDLLKLDKMDQNRPGVGALEQGSAAAYSAINKFQNQDANSDDPAKQLKAAIERGNKIQVAQDAKLKQIVDALVNQKVVGM